MRYKNTSPRLCTKNAGEGCLGARVGGGGRICKTLRYFCYGLHLSLLCWHVGSRVALRLYMQSDYGELNSNLLVYCGIGINIAGDFPDEGV